MRLSASDVKNIKNRKTTFVKNFTTIFKTGNSGESLEYNIQPTSTVSKEEKDYDFNFISKIVERDGVDLIFSFTSMGGDAHTDAEDVFLIGLLGKTVYREYQTGEDYQVEKGDLLYIPKGNKHKAISVTPRIIASIGFYA